MIDKHYCFKPSYGEQHEAKCGQTVMQNSVNQISHSRPFSKTDEVVPCAAFVSFVPTGGRNHLSADVAVRQ
jgi:hypothetical protein